jgi:hypothetical protein
MAPPARKVPPKPPRPCRHAGVVPFIVNNNPETMERGRRSFPTAAGWFFTRPGTRTNGGSRRHDSLTLALVLRGRARRALRAFLRMRRPTHAEFAARRRTVAVSSYLTMSNSPHLLVPAAQFCARGLRFASLTPIEGWAERRETFGCVRGTRWAYHDAIRQARARRLASHDAGRPPLGAPPWRFFTRGRASLSAALLTLKLRRAVGSVTASSSQPGPSAWRAGSRASRGQRLRAAAAGRHTSLRLGSPLEGAPR